MNVKDEADVKKAIESGIAKFERNDEVVSNAGFTHFAAIEEISDADAREEFDINVFGLLNVTRNILPAMRKQGSGHIFNVSSLGACSVGPLSGICCVTKHAVKAISETLAQEVKEFGIKVAEMENPYESLPMEPDCCDGIRDICANTVKLMEDMRSVAETTNY